jgi:diadenosine tetraphosphate (Ap4A) HIT family hydrolase/5-methylcytosine-specific restriction endonuclease McrA
MTTFEKLKKFIVKDMRTSHIYQPVMLIELLKNNGKRSVTEIAKAFVNRDPTQVEYYSNIVKNMVGKVLTKNRGITYQDGETYHLSGINDLTHFEREDLIQVCEQRLESYESKRGQSIWEHRRRGHRPVSGSIRYEVLKRAEFRCELCGISAEEKNLEVDHIHPKSLGGKDDLSNYQALCYSCNAAKRNTDSTDFRERKTQYTHRVDKCLFCDVQAINRDRVIAENSLAYVIRDGFPVTEFHSLVIPKRHVKDYFDLTQAEINAINQLLKSQKTLLDETDTSITGYNIGINCGESAGQTAFHCHLHLIPRRDGDVENPKGGVRHVISSKGYY